MSEFIIGLGSNLGNRESLIEKAIGEIGHSIGRLMARSSLYESEPWGFDSPNRFLNGAVRIETDLSPLELLDALQRMERNEGRIRITDYADRSLDADILLRMDSGREIFSGGEEDLKLEIPHPRLHLRKFVLLPLAELAPEWVHPVLNKNAVELLSDCPDQGAISLFRKFRDSR